MTNNSSFFPPFIRLMEEIRHPPVEVGSLSHYLQGLGNMFYAFFRWLFGISSINSIICWRPTCHTIFISLTSSPMANKKSFPFETNGDLVGGFNPFDKYYSNWIISLNRGEHNKYFKLPPSDLFWQSMTLENHVFSQRKTHQKVFERTSGPWRSVSQIPGVWGFCQKAIGCLGFGESFEIANYCWRWRNPKQPPGMYETL